MSTPPISKALVAELEAILGQDNVLISEADRIAYATDAAVLKPCMPGVVLRPRSTEAMGRAIKFCNDNGLKLTVRGAGTNLSGGVIPSKGGVVLLTAALNEIIEVNADDMYAVVQPGVITAKLHKAAEAKGLFYPPDPGSQAVSTLGGNVAENAGGLHGLKYGVTKDYVLGVDFFDVNGEVIKSGGKSVKCVSGFNLSQLMVASEGALGVFSEITFKLIPKPRTHQALLAVFDDMGAASEAVAAIIAEKIVPCTLEFMDNFTIRAVEGFSKAGLPLDAAAMLLIEVDGHPAQVADDAESVQRICGELGARSVQKAASEEERNKIWKARRAALSSLARLRPTTILEDATVPRSKIPAMVHAVGEIAKKYDLDIGTFGHAGDGNLHPTILTDKRDEKEFARAEEAIGDIFDAALELGGTLSGEHGIGIAKLPYLEKELGAGTLRYSRKLKRAVDPNYILNPGKLIPEK